MEYVFSKHFTHHMSALDATVGFFNSSDDITFSEYKKFVSTLLDSGAYPGIEEMGFVQRIASERVEDIEKSMQTQGQQSFHIWPAGERDEYYSILFLEPATEKGRTALGFDMFTVPQIREALMRARDTGKAASTAPVDYLGAVKKQKNAHGLDILFFSPVYATQNIPSTVAERQEQIMGYIYKPFRFEQLVQAAFGTTTLAIKFEVYDGPAVQAEKRLYNYPFAEDEGSSAASNENASTNIQAIRRLELGGRTWTFVFKPTPQLRSENSRDLLIAVFMGGVIFSALIAWIARLGEIARQQIEDSEVRFHSVFNLQYQYMAILSPAGIVLDVNELPLKVAGIDYKDVIGKLFWETGWWDDLPYMKKIWCNRLKEASRQDEPILGVDTFRASEDKLRIAESSVTAVRNEKGRVEYFIVQANDITERYEAEEELRAETERLEILNKLGQALAVKLDLRSLVQLASDEATKLSGAMFGIFFYNVMDEDGETSVSYTVSDLSQKLPNDFEIKCARDIFEKTFADEKTLSITDFESEEESVFEPCGISDEHVRIRSCLSVPVVSRCGDILGGLCLVHEKPNVFTNKTIQLVEGVAAQAAVGIENARLYEAVVQSEERFHQLAVKAELANNAKSEFLANMSHEIRTPMNVIIGLTDIMSMKNHSPEKQAEFLRTLRTSSQQLMDLINDLMDITKIESEVTQMRKDPLKVQRVIDEIIRVHAEKARQKNIYLKYEEKNKAPCPAVLGDKTRLRQVIMNIVSNAVKFTEEGGVRVVLDWRYEGDDNVFVTIDVIDTGIGISPEKQDFVFGKFSQADSSITRRYGGSGLGLSISKNLTTLMGGEINLDSEVGKGTRFRLSFRFPVCQEVVPAAEQNNIEKKEKGRKESDVKILLAEDYEQNLMVATSFLEALGYVNYTVAHTGAEVLELLEEHEHDFDILLLDIQMPVLDGLSTVKKIREQEKKENLPHMPVIGVTAHALKGDREKCLEAGMDDYISKPFQMQGLSHIIERYTSGYTHQETA